MTHLALAFALSSSLIPIAAHACECEGKTQATLQPIRATVSQVATWTKEKQATPVDVNGQQTRASQGVIPGAVLLTSSSQYDLKELPAARDTKLVFYCVNERCSASHAAAQRAMRAGYTNVAVLPEGIAGWKQAGQPTAKPDHT